MAISLKNWIGTQLFNAFMNEYNENMTTIETAVNTLETNNSLLGRRLKFTATVTLPNSTLSSSTGFHYASLSIPMPSGYVAKDGTTARGDYSVQPLDGGLWVCNPVSKSADGRTLVANIGAGAPFTTRDIVVAVDVLIV